MIAAPKISTNNTAWSFDSGLARTLCLYAATALSLAAAMIHLWVTPEHFGEWWGYGGFFVVTALAQGIYAVLLLRWPGRRVYLAGIAGNLAIVSGFVAAYTAGMPLGPHAGEVHPLNALGIITTSSELALILALVALSGSFSAARAYVFQGAVLAFGSSLVLHALYAGTHAAHGLNPVLHWAWNSLLAIPLAVLVIWLATPLARWIVAWAGLEDEISPRITWALLVSMAYAGASIPADVFTIPKIGTDTFLVSALGDGGAVLGVVFLLLLGLAFVRGLPWEGPKVISFWRPRAFAVAAGLAAAVAVVAGPSLLGQDFSKPAVAQQSAQCNAQTYDHSYNVAAINVNIPYNRWGQRDPEGQVFVLQGDKQATKNWHVELGRDADGTLNPANDPAGADNRRLRPRPLVLRANAGDCVKVEFTNELQAVGGDGLPNNPRASMKVWGPSYDARTSDGSAVGFNNDTTVSMGQTIEYYWRAPDEEGFYMFRDQAGLAGSEANSGSVGHGLFGALAVEPAGSTWTDPETGQPVYQGARDHNRITKESGDPYIDADIHPASARSFRETVQIAQDEIPHGIGFGFNYGSEPLGTREANRPSDSIGEETWLSSWPYGDPALIKLASGLGPWKPDMNKTDTADVEDCGLEKQPKGSCYVSNVTHTYVGDPSKIRYAMGGSKETHVFHMHAHQWLAEPKDTGASGATPGSPSDQNMPESTTIDSNTFGPNEGFTADLLFGSGSKPGTIGDSIFHCHLYPHFAEGFWSLFRTHDVLEDGTNTTPDGIKVRNLEPLPDGINPPKATADNPGYPRFIPGKFGWRAPQPVGGMSEQNDNQDVAGTVKREDLSPATRIVAGQPLDQAELQNRTASPVAQELLDKLKVEQQVQQKHYGAKTPKPGAPLTDPCPAGSREVTFNASIIQTDITYNERGDHDTQGRIMVPNKGVDAILAGTKEPEPMNFRVNSGDCINFNLTNRLPNWLGNDAFLETIQTNMVGQHIHLVKFDVLGSDGSSNGWNYQQAAFSKEQSDFDKRITGDNLKPEEKCDQSGCRLDDPANWDPTTKSVQSGPNNTVGQTITERWYADYDVRTVFTHDHHFAAEDQNRGLWGALIVEPKNTDFRNPKTGDWYQPIDNASNGQACGQECEGTAVGTKMDIIGPGPNDDFREFGLSVQDFVSLTRKGGDPQNPADTIAPPGAPEHFPSDDPGTMGINYKNAPLKYRETDRRGQPSDPAYAFSSTVHGDPKTPLLEAYSEDPVRVRLIQGAMEEQHVMTINGMRWRNEPDDPESPYVNAKEVGISEAFNFEVPKITCGANDTKCIGDYLYSGTSTDDLYLGVWGILRAYGKVDENRLLPLPDNVPQAQGGITVSPQALEPPNANSPGTPCPVGAPTKKFNVVAMEADIKYNKHGDHDPFGLIYALASDEQAIRNGSMEPEPLVLRANEGDCIEARLTNKLTNNWLNKHGNAGTNGDPVLPTEGVGGTPSGLRVSLHPQLVQYDVRGSDGTAVGFNRDQTVGPGESRLYRWYADDVSPGELGATNLTDFGDVRGHRHHGLFAGLNIEPRGATYHDPTTGERINSAAAADIRVPGANNDFREFTTFFQDGLNLRDKSNAIIEDPFDHPPAPGEPAAALDSEDQGEKGFNYSNAPFNRRIGENMDGVDGARMASVFNSRVHGDPDTPIFRAFAGDDVRMRVLQGADKPRQHTFQFSGHSWRTEPDDPGSSLVGSEGGFSVGRALNVELPGAGGPDAYAGDYLYGDGAQFHSLSGGLWGIMRVYPKVGAAAALNPTPLRNTDNPFASGNHPILPLETNASLTRLDSLEAKPAIVTFGNATTLSGNLSSGRRILANQPVILEQKPAGAGSFRKLGDAVKTDRSGNFSFSGVKPKKHTEYRVSFAGDARSGLRPSTSPTTKVKVRALVTTKTSAKSVKRGEVVAVSGLVAPKHNGTVRLTIKLGNRLVANKAVALKNSRYVYRYKTGKPGRYTVQVTFAGDRDHLGSKSRPVRFRVTR